MAKDTTAWAIIATIPILGFILVYVTGQQKDRLVKFHAVQGLVLGIASIVLNAVLVMLVVTLPLAFLVGPATLVLWIINLINAAKGKMVPTPLIGKFAGKLGL